MKRAMIHAQRLRPLVPALQAALVVLSANCTTIALAQTAGLPLGADAAAWSAAHELPQGGRIVMSVSAGQAPADGRTALRVELGLFDAAGQPVTRPTRLRLDTSLGTLQLPADADRAIRPLLDLSAPGPRQTRAPQLDLLVKDGQATLWLHAPQTPGDAQLRARSGAVAVQGEVRFAPDLRPLLAVGLVEGIVKLGRMKRDANAPELIDPGFEESLRNWQHRSSDGERQFGGRAAFYVKGTIAGNVLLTAAADSDKDTRAKLFRDIDPNQFYPVYGDASTREFDARSRGRLFVRVDQDRSYALLGDFQSISDNPAQRLASYQRSLYGARSHLEQGPWRANVFAAHGRQRQFVDEMPGRGISGPYAIGQADALANSEQVEILVRDRTQPALVLQRRTLTRFVDYDFEPFSGRIVFRQPVPSVDERLNPVSIRISYEVDKGGERFWVGGADATLRLNEQLVLGLAYAQDDNSLAPYKLGGVNATLTLGPRTRLTAELAGSRGSSFYNQDALTLSSQGTAATAQSGQAARMELRHDGEQLQLRAHAARAEAGFQNSQGGLSPGRQELALQASQALSPALRVRAELTDTQDRSGTATDGAARRAAGLTLEWTMLPGLRLDAGLNQVRERQVAGASGFLSAADAQAGASSVGGLGSSTWSSFGFGGSSLLASPVMLAPATTGSPAITDRDYTSLRLRLSGEVTPALSLYAEHERADGDRQRSAVGADYKLDGRSRVYARHEFANSLTGPNGLTSDGSKSSTSAIGVDTAYMPGGQVFSELRKASTANGDEALGAVGVRNQWQIAEGLSATTAIERQQARPSAGSALDATAIALGAEYSANPLWRTGGKLEWRDSTLQDSTLASLGLDRALADDWTAILRALHLTQRGRATAAGNDETQARYQLGLAYRDTGTNRWHALARIERRSDDRRRAGGAGLNALDDSSRSWIASLHANVQPKREWTHAGQLAWKSVDETFSGTGDPVRSSWNGSLLGWRSTVDIGERWDASVYASLQRAQGARLRGLGAEVGYRLMDNLWLSAGYTGGRHSDVDLFSANQSWNGAHIRLRFKFDEALLRGKP